MACSFRSNWTKFGGSHGGKQKLAAKLAKKYGTTVRLELAASSQSQTSSSERAGVPPQPLTPSIMQHPEDWYQLRQTERGSGVVVFTSNRFDPFAALHSGMRSSRVESANPEAANAPILDRVDQFCSYLPWSDLLY